jgi:hypothetical protein
MCVKSPRDGYVRCETLMPVIAVSIAPILEMPTRRALGPMTACAWRDRRKRARDRRRSGGGRSGDAEGIVGRG